MRVHVLLVNDDGFRAPGLAALMRAFAQNHRVTVCAPSAERSAAGHSMSIINPLHVGEHDVEGMKVYSTDGTPVDCVRFGLHLTREDPPDIVVSGINNGRNQGVDVYPSGTVAAAREASMRGFPAIAVSIGSRNPLDYGVAARMAVGIAESLVLSPPPKGTMLNINVPNLLAEDIKGLKLVRLAEEPWETTFDEYTDGSGRKHWFVGWGESRAGAPAADTDVGALNEGFVTATYLSWAAVGTGIAGCEELLRSAAFGEGD